MSILWSVMPTELILAGSEQLVGPFREVEYQGMSVLVTPTEDGKGRIERLISPRPSDFLRPDCQPGMLIPLS